MVEKDPAASARDRYPVLIRSPKQQAGGGGRPSPGTRYYAGYERGFVEDVLTNLSISENQLVIDPWNGSGTTTEVLARTGRRGIGIDINPVMVIVAKSKLLTADVGQSLTPIAADLIHHTREQAGAVDCPEPLRQWFAPATARYLRGIERAIQHLLMPDDPDRSFSEPKALDDLSSIASSFYVVLFETVRSFLTSYTTSNPTWFKQRDSDAAAVYVPPERIAARFRAIERQRHRHLRQAPFPGLLSDNELRACHVALGSSTALPPSLSSIDACLTSPPYCTRIDYPVLTRPELAVLGIGEDARMRQLRQDSIGTTTMNTQIPQVIDGWGETAHTFLRQVCSHESKASATYYYRYFLQYFDTMYKSLNELNRVLVQGAPCALVVQDSYYKEIYNDLAAALTDMATSLGWREAERIDFPVRTTMAASHPGARRYRSSFAATETLLVLRKPAA